MQVDTKQERQAAEPEAKATEPVATDAAKPQAFTSRGQIPPVMNEEPAAAGPSASEIAFDGKSRMRVNATALNVRTSANKGDNVIGVLHHGTEVQASGHEGEWIRIAHESGEAYVHGNYVQAIKNAGEPDPRAVKIAEHHAAKAATDGAQQQAPEIPPPAKIEPPPAPVTAGGAEHDDPKAVPTAPAEQIDEPEATQTTHAAPPAPAEPQHVRTPVHEAATQAHADVAAGKQPQHQAVQQVIDTQQKQGDGMVDLAMQTIGGLLAVFGSETAQAAPEQPAPPAHATQAPQPTQAPQTAPAAHAPQPAHAAAGSYLASYTSLGGTRMDDLKTSKAEATILNELRHKSERFNPAWLIKAQVTLGVVGTGAMNTETLRAMRRQRPDLDADKIVANNGGFLTALAPGEPFIKTAEGFGDDYTSDKDRKDAKGKTKADRAARRLGYEDYDTYFESLQTSVKFLGVERKDANLTPHMVQRLAIAEDWLRQRHPEAKTDKALRDAIGWNGEWNGSYQANKKLGVSHFHTMGLAVDIDAGHNGYVFTGRKGKVTDKDDDETRKKKEGADTLMSFWERHTKNAAKIYGGEGVSASTMASWSEEMSTDELWAKIHTTSESWRKYLKLADDPVAAKAEFDKHQLPEADLTDLTTHMKSWWGMGGRKDAKSLTTHTQELLVALRDVAGLSWGGSEMSSNENGDFMHFDCRHDTLGKHLFDFNNGR